MQITNSQCCSIHGHDGITPHNINISLCSLYTLTFCCRAPGYPLWDMEITCMKLPFSILCDFKCLSLFLKGTISLLEYFGDKPWHSFLWKVSLCLYFEECIYGKLMNLLWNMIVFVRNWPCHPVCQELLWHLWDLDHPVNLCLPVTFTTNHH